jgi:hypothetical protein
MKTHVIIPWTIRFALLLLPCLVQAQPVLQHPGEFETGMEMHYLRVQPQLANAGPEGADVVWDFSTIGTSTDTIRQQILHPDSSQHGSLFPHVTHVEALNDGTRLFIEQGEQDHLWGVLTNTGLLVSYSDPYTFLQRPLTYGSMIKDISARSYAMPPFEYNGNGTSTTHCDGWGTLNLPVGTFTDVLRVRYEHVTDDVDQGGGIINIRSITYAWYNDAYRGDLLRIDTTIITSPFFNQTIANVSYMIHETPLQAPHQEVSPFKLHLADGQLHIIGNFNSCERLEITIRDAAGRTLSHLREIIISTRGHVTIPIPLDNSTGMHLVTATISGEGGVRTATIKTIN